MAQSNVEPAPHSWSVSGSKKITLPPQPKSDNSPVKEIIQRLNMLRTRTQSEPVHLTQKTEEEAQPVKESTAEKHELDVQLTTPTKPATYKRFPVETSEPEDLTNSSKIDIESTTTKTCRYYSTVPRSPSVYSTASTGSLDSLLSSLDIFLPEILQATGEYSPEVAKMAKSHSRRSSLPEKLQSENPSKLVLPTSHRRSSSSIPAPKSRCSSQCASNNTASIAPQRTRPRHSSLSAIMMPLAKPTRRFTQSARSTPPISSPCARSRSNSSSRYLEYDSSPRFAATKALNIERRRQLEERNRHLAALRIKHSHSNISLRPRTSEWQGRLDQVRSRLFDFKDNSQAVVKAKTTTSRRRTASSQARV
ncbi:hypothetical protein PHMEG_0001536 [Phytophthora megakarya]|uniref:Uncharacterized protein n=1 Tax=Phytophthora megakarya TaxID=4795 RepID=A0A225X0W8_9STRA|nr:hypothetical protein PHMEG_0001536 [Phytophthora megakarya]